jgi:hypothetical protein
MQKDRDGKIMAILVVLLVIAAIAWIQEYNLRVSAERRANAAERALVLERGE